MDMRTGKKRHPRKAGRSFCPKKAVALKQHARFEFREGNRSNKPFSVPPWEEYETEPFFPVCDFLGCLITLELLQIETSRLEKDLIKACVQACANRSWAELFLSGHFSRARDYLLHVALQIAVDTSNWSLFHAVSKDITDKGFLVCAYMRGIKRKHTGWTLAGIAKHLYNTSDGQKAMELCLRDMISCQNWAAVCELLWSASSGLPKDARDLAVDCALQHEQWDVVRLAIYKGVSIGCLGRALAAALKSGSHCDVAMECLERVDVRQVCVQMDLDLNRVFDNGRTVLHLAAEASAWEVVKSLVHHGAVADIGDHEGTTVLHHAVWGKLWSIVTILTACCRDLANVVSTFGPKSESPFHIMCKEGKKDLVLICIERGVELDHLDSKGCTAMYLAALRSRWKIVDLLLERGADPDVETRNGRSVLHEAAASKKWELVDKIIKRSKRAAKLASCPMYQADGATVLHVLSEAGQVDLLHTLLLMNADPLVQNHVGETLLTTAMYARKGRENLIRVLIQSGMTTHQAVLSDSVLRQSSVTFQEWLEVSPMALAVWSGMLRTVKVLYASGASLNRELHLLLHNPTMRARLARRGFTDITAFLVEANSQPRCLSDLCTLRISHLTGCHPDCGNRLKLAGLPKPLCDLVMMDHLVSSEFASECGVEPRRAETPWPRRELSSDSDSDDDSQGRRNRGGRGGRGFCFLWSRGLRPQSLSTFRAPEIYRDVPSVCCSLARYSDTFRYMSKPCSCNVTV
ncbi:hypothetical protein BaRGS_00009002 [Batillaria attramentaria]|uniref:Ankyrin repeat protein n=1 Tax=Batillaria attramentaria TaxID=370345 RepID=A0ABD0LJH3_9CAEN